MNYRCLLTSLALLIGVALIGVGAALSMMELLIAGVVLLGGGGAAYVLCLFNPSTARSANANANANTNANAKPRIVIMV